MVLQKDSLIELIEQTPTRCKTKSYARKSRRPELAQAKHSPFLTNFFSYSILLKPTACYIIKAKMFLGDLIYSVKTLL